MQHVSNKLHKIAAPTTLLSFEVTDMVIEEALNGTKSILDQLSISHRLSVVDPSRESEGTRIVHLDARTNSWSRAARRAMARQTSSHESSTIEDAIMDSQSPVILSIDIRVSAPPKKRESISESFSASTYLTMPNSLTIQMIWTFGQDRVLFESFFLHFRSRFLQLKSTGVGNP